MKIGLLINRLFGLTACEVIGPIGSYQEWESKGYSLESEERFERSLRRFFERSVSGTKLYVKVTHAERQVTEMLAENGEMIEFLEEEELQQVGIVRLENIGESFEMEDGLAKDCYDALQPLQNLIDGKRGEGKPLQLWLGASGFQGQLAELIDLSAFNCPDVGVVLGQGERNGIAEVLEILGLIASRATLGYSLAQRIGGDLSEYSGLNAAWMVNGFPVHGYDEEELEECTSKGYFFGRRFKGKAGIYLNKEEFRVEVEEKSPRFSERQIRDEAIRLVFGEWENQLKSRASFNTETGLMDENTRAFIETYLNAKLLQQFVLKGLAKTMKIKIDPEHDYQADSRLPLELRFEPEEKLGKRQYDLAVAKRRVLLNY